jgi:hypothetical protein
MSNMLSLDSYRLLGRSGLRISPLGLGAMTFGTDWGWGADEQEGRRIFDAYIDRGGNFIDTANNIRTARPSVSSANSPATGANDWRSRRNIRSRRGPAIPIRAAITARAWCARSKQAFSG